MTDEVHAQLRAAAESIDAAELLLEGGHYGFSAARSWYTLLGPLLLLNDQSECGIILSV